ncbi:hypothetical protein LUZ60_010714 [Juncus effusus]|nr:hypothetical protein LUZ60_010714 [Juncus effusus]
MDSKSKSQVDFLEESVLLEETQYQEGFKEGYNDGLIPGKEEAKDVGLKTGFQTGEELGFYKGCITIWESILRIDPRSFSSRVCKDIEKLRELVEGFPLMDPENENVQEGMEKIRLKFRVVCANLGVKLEYEGQPSSSKRDVEDL